MKRYFIFASIVIVVGLSLFAGNMQATGQAKHGHFSDMDLSGGYAYQLTGTINFPAGPLAFLNGPFAANGRMFFDGRGRVKAQDVSNFNGQIIPSEIDATYDVNPDGTYSLTLTVELGQIPATVTYQGVLTKDGDEARFIQSGFSIPGVTLPPGYVGAVVVGSLIKQ